MAFDYCFAAAFAAGQTVISGKILPMFLLSRSELSCSSAKRTGIFHGRKYSLPDKLGLVWNRTQGFDKSRIGLEADYFLLHLELLLVL